MAIFRKKHTKEEVEMGFLDHLEALRWHILRSAASILICGIVVFSAKDFTFNTLIFGPLKKDFITYRLLCKLGEAACMTPPDITLTTREFGEQFFVHFQVAFWLGLILSFPLVIWEIWKFVKPGLYENEKQVTRGIVFVCSTLFLLGVSFGYFVIAPFAITWLGNYSVGTNAINAPTLSSYVNYITMFTIPTGLIFELPIGAYFLGKIGVISSAFLRNYRRHAIVIIFIVAAIVTPPDVVSQILISLPVLLLYEVSIMVVRSIEKKDALALEEAEELPVPTEETPKE
ncbi:MAG TPA: twin-arginine translocase subunit TatC [Saprospiraceae bacterium]|nr:twin-arginine translocase subunit TatC [Saprospiraceae bacterium]HRG64889.1 twin-arginine translocase subunit TatC [Saprospiraceae bacterium]